MFCLGVNAVCLLFLPAVTWSFSEALIQGPKPTNRIAPIGGTAEFTCTMNTSELTSGVFATISWSVNNQSVAAGPNQVITELGDIKTGTVRLYVTERYTSGVIVQCSVVTRSPPSKTFSGANAVLKAYGSYNYYSFVQFNRLAFKTKLFLSP